MRRPRYETEANKLDEANAIAHLVCLGYSVVPLGPLSPGDFFINKGEYTALVEFKRRNNPALKYPTVIMPEQKLRKCLTLADEMAIEFLYMVQFNDGLYIAVVNQYHTSPGGRTDRGDPRDLHKVAHINKNDFRRLI